MYNFNQHLHFIGIGGVGMAGIAEVLLNLGYSLGGSDVKRSALTDHLERLGAKVFIGHSAANLNEDTSVVVISSAIDEKNVELQEAKNRNIPVIPRAEMLAELMRMKYGIAIAGSHGKTTTTSMTAKILHDAGFDPTVILGGRVLSQKSGASLGLGAYLVAEADESDGSFCLLRPAIAVVTNIDAEHLSFYGSFGALEQSFFRFMSSVPFYGLVVACFDDPVVARIAEKLERRVLSYGLQKSFDVCASDIEVIGPKTSFTLSLRGHEAQRVTIPLMGSHMVSNALAAIAVGIEVGAYVEEACTALETFPGVARRSEVIGRCEGVLVIDDYAHHPRELSATLSAVRRAWVPQMIADYGAGRLIVIFQPHRYSRTKELFSDFLGCFADADVLMISEIYAAGETPLAGVSGEALADAVQHPAVSFVGDLQQLVPRLAAELRPGDVVLTAGAGSVGQVAYQLTEVLRARASQTDGNTENATQPSPLPH